MWVVMFVLNSIYPPLSAVIGLPACMYIFSFVCVLNALFGLIFMFETRGKSHEEIMVMLSPNSNVNKNCEPEDDYREVNKQNNQ